MSEYCWFRLQSICVYILFPAEVKVNLDLAKKAGLRAMHSGTRRHCWHGPASRKLLLQPTTLTLNTDWTST